MHPDGKLENWHEIHLPEWNYGDDLSHSLIYGDPSRQRRYTSASLNDGMAYIAESMKDNQGYFVQDQTDSWVVEFPYAWYLDPGRTIENITTGETYTVDRVFYDEVKRYGEIVKVKTGRCRLVEGTTAPRISDFLVFEDNCNIVFKHGYPRALAESYKFDAEHQLVTSTKPWTNTITYQNVLRQPGTLSGDPFKGTKELKKRNREGLTDRNDPRRMIQVEGQLFDNIVQFDCWAKTNSEAEALRDWLEDFMGRYTWVWKYNGIVEILYWQRNVDALVTRWRNDIVHRSVQYFFRTEKLTTSTYRRITNLTVRVDVQAGGEDLTLTTSTGVDPSGVPVITGDVPVEFIDGAGAYYSF